MVCYDIPSNCTSSVDILKKTWPVGSHISMKKMMNVIDNLEIICIVSSFNSCHHK
ncbi:hypothetical protein T4A_13958 [Trichinella pseudospiralis]|uniref:Uncharacterized protein n=1 Tax=Trichinella pseudospiralis TaxID=6337 RepID=A0A0V1C4T3_TRIPS|nr:hypothetical protein T4A_13958 [Trichinella pseudospiralis]